MKRKIKLFTNFIALASIALILTQCGKDEAKYSEVTGTVLVSEGVGADGAIVSMSSSPNGENVVAKTVADASGAYSFTGVSEGTYYVNATWDPENSNNALKAAGAVILTGVEQEVSVSGDATADIMLAGAVPTSELNFNAADWSWDNTHSTIEFEFPYDAFNAVFTGHFATAGIDELIINSADLSTASIKAWVDVTSVETGSPSPPGGHGRDGLTGCIGGTFKVDKDPADTITVYSPAGDEITDYPNDATEAYVLWNDVATSYEKQSSVIGASGVATFESTEVMAYGNGYAAKGTFTFAGVSNEVTLYFNYLEGYSEEDDGEVTNYVSFYGTFKFAAEADYSVSSGHIGDADVTVKISAQYNAPA